MASILGAGNGSPSPISVTLTFGAATPTTTTPTTTPPATTPGAEGTPGATAAPKHLPFTGVPAVAELDMALVLAVLGATIVTAVKRLNQRSLTATLDR